MIKNVIAVFLILLLSSCKTFIVKGSGVGWTESDYDDFGKVSDRMCITNQAKDDNSSPCYDKGNTIEIVQYENGKAFVFPIKKSFIENTFKSSALENELEGKFTFRSSDDQINVLVGIASLFSDTVKYGIKDIERDRKESYIKKSIKSLFYTAYNRFDNNYNDDTVGIGIRPIKYISPLDSENGSYGLAEVFFVDMDDLTIIGETIYGYIEFFEAGHGGFNVLIPTCYTKTSKRIDGCEFDSKEEIKKWVRKSQKSKDGYGKPVFEMSFATYIPPPDEPVAKGIPLDF